MSIRELALRHRVHRRTVRAALADAVPPERKVPDRPRPVSGPWESTVRTWLEADLSEPRKQRHTARRVWQRLLDEKGAMVAESTIRALVHDLKIEIGADRSSWSRCRRPTCPVGTRRSTSVISSQSSRENGCSCTCL